MGAVSEKKIKCAFCGGSGIQPRSLRSRCIACRGKGEAEFDGPAIQCSSCKGNGRAVNSSMLSCIRCSGLGVTEKIPESKDAAVIITERLGEIAKRLRWARKEAEKKTKKVEERLKSVKSFIKEIKKAQWFENLTNKIKKDWKFPWGK
ncbi:MAG: hypothetical protein HYW78_02720 [Parcubacteria group bacterium]|nr:hypothetical protein [Parcubacteria group bacterium]